MTRLTLAIAGRTLFGLDLSTQSEQASRSFGAALAAIGRRGPANLQVPLWVPTPGNLRLRRVLRELDVLVYDNTMAAMLVAMFGEDGIMQSPFWFTAEGAFVGFAIGYFATRFGGEGSETVGR